MPSTYEMTTEEVGVFEKKPLRAVHMPRETFVDIVREALEEDDEYDYTPIREEMLATARRVPRFPMREWLNEDRGCGCLVGEYLVATKEIREHNEQIADLDRRHATVEEYAATSIQAMLAKRPHGEILFSFGNKVDEAVERHLKANGVDGDYEAAFQVRVVVIDDEVNDV